ncbi:MAG: Ni/Fe hydrogenase subunit alpha [Candidatus Heimdallarchaeota archaeon]|nr:MAG: Ni/Fe hydrogenase subunit alpha [Candidatus Heimdallarchaeota archaeon]
MTKTITIDPVTRIEGHGKVTIYLDDNGTVNDARFHVTQIRGFEKFCEGRPFHEMPSITARICGICPVSHLIASSKACDDILAVKIPETGAKLRRLLNLAQFVQSHALSFFYLSSPDLFLGMKTKKEMRNIFGILEAYPALAKDGIKLRKFGQQIIEKIAGKRIHPPWVVPGGVTDPLTLEKRDEILNTIPEAKDIIRKTLDRYKKENIKLLEENESYGDFSTNYLGLTSKNLGLELYDGFLSIIDSNRKFIIDRINPRSYKDHIGEAVEPWSYLKFPYYKGEGYPKGIYRVGPLARLNLVTHCGTPEADIELEEFKSMNKKPIEGNFHTHYARLIEILFGIEKIEDILNDPEVTSNRIRAYAGVNKLEGIGVSEAPRGTLIHHYKVNEEGNITWVNLIIATAHNNLAMNKAILQVAQRYIKGLEVPKNILNRVEAVIRTFDPCLSCSTHAISKMPLQIQLVSSRGKIIHEMRRI